MNGRETIGARDTGSYYTLINAALLSKDSRDTGEYLTLKGLFSSDPLHVKIFEVKMSSPSWGIGKAVYVRVGAVANLPIGVIVGNGMFKNNPQLTDTVQLVQTV